MSKKEFRSICWNWDKKRKKISQDGVISYKLTKEELEEYLKGLKDRKIVRV